MIAVAVVFDLQPPKAAFFIRPISLALPMPVKQKAAQFAQPRLVADQHHGVVAGKALEEARQGAGVDVGIECRQHGVILGEIIGGLAAARGF